jgi:hypothetical protein
MTNATKLTKAGRSAGLAPDDELPNNTPVRHRDPAIQGTGKTSWLCIRNCYRVRWADGTYTTTPRADLVVDQ